jgi:hypothetical protein
MLTERAPSRAHRFRGLVVIIGVVLFVAATVVVLVGRSRLEDGNAEIDRRWIPLRPSLVTRYQKLESLNEVFLAENGAERGFNRRIERGLERWEHLTNQADIDEEAEAVTALALEQTARHLVAFTTRSNGLQPTDSLMTAIVAFARSPVPAPELPAYNRAVVDYEATRDSVIGAPAAHLLAFHGRTGLGLTIV